MHFIAVAEPHRLITEFELSNLRLETFANAVVIRIVIRAKRKSKKKKKASGIVERNWVAERFGWKFARGGLRDLFQKMEHKK